MIFFGNGNHGSDQVRSIHVAKQQGILIDAIKLTNRFWFRQRDQVGIGFHKTGVMHGIGYAFTQCTFI
ncbi:hypothetical protein SDC9_168965 [bioreactor metagenome]|uniref:Uncharacterized protein n=1 Tax=bioreactor metagenome TaxID=1076179 RepID=A0A645G4K9_9ZZZZ